MWTGYVREPCSVANQYRLILGPVLYVHTFSAGMTLALVKRLSADMI